MVVADPYTLVGLGLLGSAVAGFTMPIFPTARAIDWQGWTWPVAPLHLDATRGPVISQGYKPGSRYKRAADGRLVLDYGTHLGVDIMYRWAEGDPLAPATDVVTRTSARGRWGYYAPPGSIVRAAGPGKIWAVNESALGLSVQIDHGKVTEHTGGVVTFYQHLEAYSREWKRGDVIQAGDELGLMGGDPANKPHLRHLHFELWFPRKGESSAAWPADPALYMAHWTKDGT